MKLVLLSFVLTLSACTSYQTARVGKNQVMVSKTTQFLWFYGGTIYTCKTDMNGIIENCAENRIESIPELQSRLEKEEREKIRKGLMNNRSSSY